MELFKNNLPPEADDWYLRNRYELTLCGTFASSLGPRREETVEGMAKLGEWNETDGTNNLPPVEGQYLVEGSYGNMDGEWESAVLPCWFHLPESEWELNDGAFDVVRRWMEIPWLPEVWEEVKAATVLQRTEMEARWAAVEAATARRN